MIPFGTLIDFTPYYVKGEIGGRMAMGLKEIKDEKEFQKDIKKGVSLVDFNAPWCSPCQFQEPILKRLASIYENRVSFYGINVDNLQNVAINLGIIGIPTLIIFKEGQEFERLVGLQTEEVLSEALQRALQNST